MNQSTLTIARVGKPNLEYKFRSTQHHRYPWIPVVRMEKQGSDQLCGYGQFTLSLGKRVIILFHGDDDEQTWKNTRATIEQEINRLLDAWEETRPKIITLKTQKGPRGRGVDKDDKTFLIDPINGPVGIFDNYGAFYQIKPSEWEAT